MSLNESQKSSLVLDNLVQQLHCKLQNDALAYLGCRYQLPRVREQQERAAPQEGKSRVEGDGQGRWGK